MLANTERIGSNLKRGAGASGHWNAAARWHRRGGGEWRREKSRKYFLNKKKRVGPKVGSTKGNESSTNTSPKIPSSPSEIENDWLDMLLLFSFSPSFSSPFYVSSLFTNLPPFLSFLPYPSPTKTTTFLCHFIFYFIFLCTIPKILLVKQAFCIDSPKKKYFVLSWLLKKIIK